MRHRSLSSPDIDSRTPDTGEDVLPASPPSVLFQVSSVEDDSRDMDPEYDQPCVSRRSNRSNRNLNNNNNNNNNNNYNNKNTNKTNKTTTTKKPKRDPSLTIDTQFQNQSQSFSPSSNSPSLLLMSPQTPSSTFSPSPSSPPSSSSPSSWFSPSPIPNRSISNENVYRQYHSKNNVSDFNDNKMNQNLSHVNYSSSTPVNMNNPQIVSHHQRTNMKKKNYRGEEHSNVFRIRNPHQKSDARQKLTRKSSSLSKIYRNIDKNTSNQSTPKPLNEFLHSLDSQLPKDLSMNPDDLNSPASNFSPSPVQNKETMRSSRNSSPSFYSPKPQDHYSASLSNYEFTGYHSTMRKESDSLYSETIEDEINHNNEIEKVNLKPGEEYGDWFCLSKEYQPSSKRSNSIASETNVRTKKKTTLSRRASLQNIDIEETMRTAKQIKKRKNSNHRRNSFSHSRSLNHIQNPKKLQQQQQQKEEPESRFRSNSTTNVSMLTDDASNTSPEPPPTSAATLVSFPSLRRLALFGGMTDVGCVNDTWIFDLGSSRWHRVENDPVEVLLADDREDAPPFPESRCGHNAAVLRYTEMWIFGGQKVESGQYFNDVWVFQIGNTDTWQRMDCYGEYPCPRWYASMVAMDQRLIVFGGEDDQHRVLSDVSILDRNTYTWLKLRTIYPNPQPRMLHSATVWKESQMIICGGSNPHDRVMDDIWSLDVQTLIWRKKEQKGKETPFRYSKTMMGHSCTCFANNMMLVGGKCGNRLNDHVWVYDLVDGSWHRASDPEEHGEYPRQIWKHAVASDIYEHKNSRTYSKDPSPYELLASSFNGPQVRTYVFGGMGIRRSKDLWEFVPHI